MVGKWTRGLTIGRGSSATVSLAATISGDLFAVKSAELHSSSLLQKESDLISQLSSPYIVQFVDCDISCENGLTMYNLLMEYFPRGTLSDQIKNHGGGFLEEQLIQKYACDVLKGLDYVHSRGIVHCDIKGQNVLIGKDGAKIGDFGCAKKVEEGRPAVISGTPLYMAPEVARGEEQGFAADIWAVGCIIVEMATGNNPWPNLTDPVSALYRIGYSGYLPCFPAWLSDSGMDFLSKCLTRDARDRWTAKELLRHPFLSGDIREEGLELVRNSPTSVLDQAFWNSVDEVPGFSRGSSDIASSIDSPANRIKNLIGDVSTIFPIWKNDEDWTTVRVIESEEIPLNEDDDDSDHQDQSALSSLVLLFDCFGDEYFDVGSGSFGTNDPRILDAAFGCVLVVLLYFEMEMMKRLLIIMIIFAESFEITKLYLFFFFRLNHLMVGGFLLPSPRRKTENNKDTMFPYEGSKEWDYRQCRYPKRGNTLDLI